jgi:hypothetical protein
MRGGSQAQLIEAGDGCFYVVKCKDNPQHRRILVNEWVSSMLLEHLGLLCPKVQMVNLTQAFLQANPDLCLTAGSRTVPIAPGFHFGSQMPVDPNRFMIYDFLPDALLRQVANLDHFLGILVFDKWMNNADSRQSIFFRAKVKEWLPGGEARVKSPAFVAMMMDHGYVFGGPHWVLDESPLTGLYCRTAVYESVRKLEDFDRWLALVEELPVHVLDNTLRQVPEWWLNGDRETLESLIEKLYRRRSRVRYQIEDCRTGRLNPFPNWS